MSHSIVVQDPDQPGDVLSAIPGLRWCSVSARAAFEHGQEVTIACDGAARGVSVQCDEDDDVIVRMFTASSRADVDLAITAVRALAKTGSGVLNEDDEGMDCDEEIVERYSDEFRSAYVTWGPTALAAQLDDSEQVAELGGPWINARISVAELAGLRAAHKADEQFSAAVLAKLVAIQDRARSLHEQLDAGNLAGVVASPDGAAVFNLWIQQQMGEEAAAHALSMLREVPDTFFEDRDVLLGALCNLEFSRDAGFDAKVRAFAVRAATADPSLAQLWANSALEMAQGGAFPSALVMFDVIADLPALPDLGDTTVATTNGGEDTVPTQSSWMCNATWAAQVDNNKLALNTARTKRYIERALPFGPVNPSLYFNLACLSFEIDDHPGALRMISLAKKHGFARMNEIAGESLLKPLHAHADWTAALNGRL